VRPILLFIIAGAWAQAACDSPAPLAPSSIPLPSSTSAPPPAAPATVGIAIAGHVYDRAWRRLAGARVEVLDGPQAGLWTTTGATGEFRLNGEFDATTRFRATMSNHRDATLMLPERCAPCNPNWWLYFSLETEAPPVHLAGSYTLTFTADATCSAIPEAHRRRTYDAVISPIAADNTTQFNVRVQGGTFLDGYDTFGAGVAGDTVALSLGDFHGSPGVAERVAEKTYLGYEGAAEVRLSSTEVSTITTSFDGVVSYCEMLAEPATRYYACTHQPAATRVLCASRNHQVVLQRR
jgi:hypothetical protein